MRLILQRSMPAIALFLVTLPGSAHHSQAIYDRQREVKVEGVVTRFLWAMPHAYIDISTPDEGAESVTWTIETGGPPGLTRSGWTPRTLVPGDHVTVIGNPSRNPERRTALLKSVVKADGSLLSLSGSPAADTANPPAQFEAADLSGPWQITPDANAVFAQLIQPRASWSLTDKGIAAVESFDVNADNPDKDCTPQIAPLSLLGALLDIVPGEDVILIRTEDHQDDRTVHMDLESHDGAQVSRQGHSIGHWENDVLVVDTTRFADHPIGNGIGLPSGPQRHFVERFALTADRTQLEYTFRLEDPEYLAEPVTDTLVFTYRPDLPFVSEPCNLESARRYLEFVEE
jgi:hypothetical protein